MSDYLVQQEDGVSRFTLQEGTGFILLQEDGPPPSSGTGSYIPTFRPRRRLETCKGVRDCCLCNGLLDDVALL